jgi:osmotically-inducible protein OsmY
VDLLGAAILILSLWVIVIVIAGLVMALRPGGVGVRLAPAVAAASGAPAPIVSNRQEIPLGGEAQVLGNVRGRVHAVVLRPDTRQIEGVQVGGGLMEAETVPMASVLGGDGNVLQLADGWQDQTYEVARNPAILRGNMPVMSADGKRIGRLRVVCYDPMSGAATALVAERGEAPTRLLVPIDRVLEAGPDRVLTNIQAGDSAKLPAFATDWELRQAIRQRFADDPGLRGLDRGLQIDVRDQRVQLQGSVADQAQADRVEQAVRNVPGVLSLESTLRSDEQLAQAVRDAIRREVGNSTNVNVTARSGVVDITGEASDRSVLRRIDAALRQVEGIQVAHNMVVVPPPSAAAATT